MLKRLIAFSIGFVLLTFVSSLVIAETKYANYDGRAIEGSTNLNTNTNQVQSQSQLIPFMYSMRTSLRAWNGSRTTCLGERSTISFFSTSTSVIQWLNFKIAVEGDLSLKTRCPLVF